MGITTNSLDRMKSLNLLRKDLRMLVCGCQNIYDTTHIGVYNGMIAQEYFDNLEMDVTTIDITGCNNSHVVDLREIDALDKFTEEGLFDAIVNHGTFEHIEGVIGFYQAYKNAHNACKVGGIMIHETPKTGHWIGHGNHYLTEDFYINLAEKMGYELIEVGEHFAMGNFQDGGLVIGVLMKTENTKEEFISSEEFLELDFREW
jgi:hypothetical protein